MIDGPVPEDQPVLAVDVGTAYTKVYLLDQVEGERRLVAVGRAPTIDDSGAPATFAALQAALTQVATAAGRPELTSSESAEANTKERPLLASTGGIARAFIVCARLGNEVEAVLQVLNSQSLHLLAVLPLTSGAATGALSALARRVVEQLPDLIVLVVSRKREDALLVQAAAETLAYAVAPSLAAAGHVLPAAVVVGDGPAAAAISALLQDSLPHRVAALPQSPVSTGGPTSDGTLAAEARRVAEVRSTTPLPERRRVLDWSGRPAVSSAAAIAAATKRLATQYDIDVLTLDLGAGHGAAIAAVRGMLSQAARADIGLAFGLEQLLQEVGEEAVSRWLPMNMVSPRLVAYARAALVRPCRLPAELDDLLLLHAFAREGCRRLLDQLGHRAAGMAPRAALGEPLSQLDPVDLIVGTGSALSHAPRAMQAALILLDAVQPVHLTQLALDRAGALAILGQLSSERATTLGQLFERDGLLNLGLCIAPIGRGREGRRAITVEVAYADRSPVTVEVPYGSIDVLPLAVGERAALKLWPAREFDIGLGRGQAATPRAEVEGGAVGIIVDARGRPLELPDQREKRQARLLQWMQSTHAYPPLTFVA